MARKRKKQQSIEKLKVKEKKARVNGSLGGDIVIFVFLCLLGAFMVFPPVSYTHLTLPTIRLV